MILSANAKYSNLARTKGVDSWEALKAYVAELPYGRTSNPKDISLVLNEGRGTCSGKHALLAAIAKENAISDVHLMVAAFKMSAGSSPKIRSVLEHFHLDSIPEAHCYLKESGKFGDYTRPGKFFNDFESRILDTRELFDYENIAQEKTAYHQNFMRNWLRESALPYSFDELWKIREACIQKLSEDR